MRQKRINGDCCLSTDCMRATHSTAMRATPSHSTAWLYLRGHLSKRKSRLKMNFRARRGICGLRPRIVRHGCTFGRRLRMGHSYFTIVQRLPRTHSPEATAALCSPFARKIRLKMNFRIFFLQMCIICCTFAPQYKLGKYRYASSHCPHSAS